METHDSITTFPKSMKEVHESHQTNRNIDILDAEALTLKSQELDFGIEIEKNKIEISINELIYIEPVDAERRE